MSYGVEIRNQANQLLIDNQNSLLHWLFTGQYLIGSYTNKPVTITWPQVVTTQAPPFVFQKIMVGGYGCGNFKYEGSPGNWWGMTLNPDIVNGDQTYTYCVASFEVPRSSQTYGIELYGAQGQRLLDSGYSAMVWLYATRDWVRQGPVNESGWNRTWYWVNRNGFNVDGRAYVLISNFTGYLIDNAGLSNQASLGYYRATAHDCQYWQNYNVYGSPGTNDPYLNWPMIYAIPSHEYV